MQFFNNSFQLITKWLNSFLRLNEACQTFICCIIVLYCITLLFCSDQWQQEPYSVALVN